MPRKRVLDPSIWTDDGMAELTARQQLLYIGLISNADDDGRQKASPVAIRLSLPTVYANVLDGEIDADLTAVLRRMRQLVAYIADERRYLVFLNYRKWQRIDRPSPSNLPPPPQPCANDRRTLVEVSSSVRPELKELREEKESPQDEPADSPVIESIAEVTGEKPYDILATFAEAIDSDLATVAPAWKKKQLSVAKRLLEEGYGADKVRRYVRYRLSETWRNGSPFDLFSIEKEIGTWEASGSPEHAAVRNGIRPTQADHNRGGTGRVVL